MLNSFPGPSEILQNIRLWDYLETRNDQKIQRGFKSNFDRGGGDNGAVPLNGMTGTRQSAWNKKKIIIKRTFSLTNTAVISRSCGT